MLLKRREGALCNSRAVRASLSELDRSPCLHATYPLPKAAPYLDLDVSIG